MIGGLNYEHTTTRKQLKWQLSEQLRSSRRYWHTAGAIVSLRMAACSIGNQDRGLEGFRYAKKSISIKKADGRISTSVWRSWAQKCDKCRRNGEGSLPHLQPGSEIFCCRVHVVESEEGVGEIFHGVDWDRYSTQLIQTIG
ncbi:chromate resistance protein [Anopheles sinensis]|uniref:Chromate resistance protein n=1 Tax=Anopheles sinensis TaxID=74873 RepID=A0A084W8L4_ANOSI|nr:chromate resistance protein [Anopheles sinensis]